MAEKVESTQEAQTSPTVSAEEIRKNTVETVTRMLRKRLYEEHDFDVTDKYIQIDLCYDSKSEVKYIQEQFALKFPGKVKTKGTLTTIFFR